MQPILQCSHLSKHFGYLRALDDVTFSLERGRIIGLLGPNGSGKSTLIKLASGLETKLQVSYLPERTYLNNWMRVRDMIDFFGDFYSNFDKAKAFEMLRRLNINVRDRLKTMSKGTKEKVQLILVMSRNADLYLLDEPIGGVDPAARDYILNTIITNYNENASVVISTHLIADVERVLDDVVFICNGKVTLTSSVDDIREGQGKSVDALFREVFRC